MMIKQTELIRNLVFLICAFPIAMIDAKTMRIPDILSLGGLAVLVLIEILLPSASIVSRLLGCVAGSLLFYLLRVTTQGLGFGDVKYAAFIGFYTGLRYFFVALLGASLSALVYFFITQKQRQEKTNNKIPFAPFLTFGGLCATLVGWFQQIQGVKL